MIKLSSRNCMVLGNDGRRRSFCAEDIQRNLLVCFRQCGVQDDWLAEHIGLLVAEHVAATRSDVHGISCEADLDRVIVAALLDAGYADVAERYAGLRRLPQVDPVAGALSACDAARLHTVLARSFHDLSEAECDRLAARVGAALSQLGLDAVGDELIRQLAAHLQRSTMPRLAASEAVAAGHGSPPAPVRDWGEHLGGIAAALLGGRILSIPPVSRTMPRARVDLDLVRLAESAGGKPLTELGFMPRLHAACRELRPALALVRHELARQQPHILSLPAHVVVHGTDVVAADYFDAPTKRAVHLLAQEIEGVVHRHVAATGEPPFAVLVTTR